VKVICIDGKVAFGGRAKRGVAYSTAVFTARLRADLRTAVEIAYDPIGMIYSDLVPRRPNFRIAHLHEVLQRPDSFLEKRLLRTIKAYDHLVVADASRAIHTQHVLNLSNSPIVMENYPLLGTCHPIKKRSDPAEPFEVIYCGSLGRDQKVDVIIRSVAKWPKQAFLTLIGNTDTPAAHEFQLLAREMGVADRIRFAGWLDVAEAEARLLQADLAIALLDTSHEQWRTALGASNKRYQYMKAGLPQIGDQNPGVPDLLENNGIGTCVSEHSTRAIASAVGIYVEDRARCMAEGAQAFELHASRFHYERVFERLLDTLGADQ
jgi:glycosyltransferase involved in cell wall biosynthesis